LGGYFHYKDTGISGTGGETIAGGAIRGRKVRASPEQALDNIQSGRPEGQCHRKQTAGPRVGKGETVR